MDLFTLSRSDFPLLTYRSNYTADQNPLPEAPIRAGHFFSQKRDVEPCSIARLLPDRIESYLAVTFKKHKNPLLSQRFFETAGNERIDCALTKRLWYVLLRRVKFQYIPGFLPCFLP